MGFDELNFKEKLESAHSFPCIYYFKFIVKTEQQKVVEQLVNNGQITVKPSSGNKYVSVTIEAQMQSSEEVIHVYKEAKKIEGLIAL